MESNDRRAKIACLGWIHFPHRLAQDSSSGKIRSIDGGRAGSVYRAGEAACSWTLRATNERGGLVNRLFRLFVWLSGDPDVLSLKALGTLYNIERDRLAFLQALEALALDCREMHEHVFAIRPAQKAESLGVVKPLHCSLFHESCSLLVDVPPNSIWS